ncbi:hypothetical protein [Enterovibrio baiacu]|uniref:hypothetical protein n=1 Tax=Enterovibrio baiacu TaxID=2491023 RepID=UPI001012237F|nr:hypothetical protein [Enterovibrio baiacu]MBE1275105.1 hypothetical protein [Enterovibrio baiacu]
MERKDLLKQDLNRVERLCFKKWIITNKYGEVFETNSMTEFAKTMGIDRSCLSHLAAGKFHTYRGFRIISKEKPLIVLRSPEGVDVKLETSVPEFCKENNLVLHAIYSLIRGTRKVHRGWVAVKTMDDEDLMPYVRVYR